MTHSIRWRMVVSYVLITLFTVLIIGVVAYGLVKQRVEQQEKAFLQSNAEAVARQAIPFVDPITQEYELQVLADTAASLGNVRVKVLDKNREVIADSGAPTQIDQFIWILPPVEKFSVTHPLYRFDAFILTIPPNYTVELQRALEDSLRIFEQLPPETKYQFIKRVDHPWGSLVMFDDQSELAGEEAISRSDQIITVPIGNEQNTYGYIELGNGLNIGAEALATSMRAFVIAATGAVLLAGIIGLLVSKRLTTPIGHLAVAANQMSDGMLSTRAPQYGDDEIGQLAQQFNQMAERLETSFDELSTERDTLRRFITDASHEIRTPITALKNFNELLLGKAGDDPETRQEFLIESKAQLDRLEWITTNLLSLSRLDAGLTPLKLDVLNVANLVDSVASPFKIQALSKGIEFNVSISVSDQRIKGDQNLLELALSNLIDNALKFTPSNGKIDVGVDFDDDNVNIWVKDTGSGISPEDLHFIFERFYRGKNATSEGSGLGLAMVKSVITAHHGQLNVTSEIDVGSTFTISLPLVTG
jgi:signal transduction histidine kinase